MSTQAEKKPQNGDNRQVAKPGRSVGTRMSKAAAGIGGGRPSIKSLAAARENRGFPIPLHYLYRDPRSHLMKRRGTDASIDVGNGQNSSKHDERLREQRTLFCASMATGDAFYSQHRWNDALRSYTKALELTPGDKNALVSRSRCRLLLGDTRGALDDAEEALSNDKQCVKALFQKGEILFQLGKFEEALVFYHLGAKQRPDMEAFHQGVRKAQEAIEVSLGVKQQHRSAVPAKRAPSERKPSTARLPPLNSSKMSGSQPTVSKAMHKTPAMKDHSVLLGDLHADKVYLEQLLQNPGMRSAGDPTQKVVNYARETLEYLKARENFWRSQQPIISYKPPKDKTARTSKTQQKRTQRQSSQATITSSEGSVRAYSSPAEFDLGEDQGGDDYDAGQADADDDVQSAGRTSQMERHEQQEEEEQGSEPSANGDDHMMHLQRTLTAMRQCNEEDNMDMCIDIYLATYRKEDDLELPEEIQARINELDSMIAEEDDPLDKMQIYMEIATLFLVDGQDENCKNVCQNVLQLASSTDDVAAYIQTCLLMAAASAYSHKATNVEPHLQRAQQLIDARRIVD